MKSLLGSLGILSLYLAALTAVNASYGIDIWTLDDLARLWSALSYNPAIALGSREALLWAAYNGVLCLTLPYSLLRLSGPAGSLFRGAARAAFRGFSLVLIRPAVPEPQTAPAREPAPAAVSPGEEQKASTASANRLIKELDASAKAQATEGDEAAGGGKAAPEDDQAGDDQARRGNQPDQANPEQEKRAREENGQEGKKSGRTEGGTARPSADAGTHTRDAGNQAEVAKQQKGAEEAGASGGGNDAMDQLGKLSPPEAGEQKAYTEEEIARRQNKDSQKRDGADEADAEEAGGETGQGVPDSGKPDSGKPDSGKNDRPDGGSETRSDEEPGNEEQEDPIAAAATRLAGGLGLRQKSPGAGEGEAAEGAESGEGGGGAPGGGQQADPEDEAPEAQPKAQKDHQPEGPHPAEGDNHPENTLLEGMLPPYRPSVESYQLIIWTLNREGYELRRLPTRSGADFLVLDGSKTILARLVPGMAPIVIPDAMKKWELYPGLGWDIGEICYGSPLRELANLHKKCRGRLAEILKRYDRDSNLLSALVTEIPRLEAHPMEIASWDEIGIRVACIQPAAHLSSSGGLPSFAGALGRSEGKPPPALLREIAQMTPEMLIPADPTA